MKEYAYTFSFTVLKSGLYGDIVAKAVIEALKKERFSGRCEYYAADIFQIYFYTVCIGLKSLKKHERKNRELSLRWWESFRDVVFSCIDNKEGMLEMNHDCCELTTMFTPRYSMVLRGIVNFRDGDPQLLLNAGTTDSWFSGEILSISQSEEREELDSYE